jgi:hypothetical protein
VKRILTGLLSAALLAGCGPKAISLPDEQVERAATCGVVATIEARAATKDIKAPLTLEAQEHILHYALLAGSEGKEFSSETAAAVLKRMPEVEGRISGGKWQDLAGPCRAAFPQAEVREPKLPAGKTEAQLQCDELADFIVRALQRQDKAYAERLSQYEEVTRKLNLTLGPGLRARAGSDLKAQQAERREALAKAAKLGSPSAVLNQCVERYG